MKTVGFFHELWSTDKLEPQPSLLRAVNEEPAPDEAELVRYLKSGHVLVDMMDTMRDVVSGDEWILAASTTLTDGEWLWRDDLAHYVRRHHVRLPEEFMACVRANGYRVPDVDEATLRERAMEADDLLFGQS
jgi:hypothetical protein